MSKDSTPMWKDLGLDLWKVPSLVEGSGAVIVGEESCVGERGLRNLVAEDGRTVDEILDRIADRYLAIDCAVFTPNPERADHVTQPPPFPAPPPVERGAKDPPPRTHCVTPRRSCRRRRCSASGRRARG